MCKQLLCFNFVLWLQLFVHHHLGVFAHSHPAAPLNTLNIKPQPHFPPPPTPSLVLVVDQFLVDLIRQQHHPVGSTPLDQPRHSISRQALTGGVAGVDEHQRTAGGKGGVCEGKEGGGGRK